jgi:hypothetical protein
MKSVAGGIAEFPLWHRFQYIPIKRTKNLESVRRTKTRQKFTGYSVARKPEQPQQLIRPQQPCSKAWRLAFLCP